MVISQYTSTLPASNVFPSQNEIIKAHITLKKSPSDQIWISYNANQLPVFCRIEHQIESKSKIPLRFRLGNLQYVNMLENKNYHIFAE